VPDAIVKHILAQAKPEILAKNVRQWLQDARKPRR